MAQLPAYLHDIQREIEGFGRAYGLDFWGIEYEILDYKKMQEVAAFGGFPVRYPHWRFGMEFEHLTKSHIYGLSKIYEMVINNDPAYAYLLEGNSLVDQKMVMAHVLGHVDFFKNNFCFRTTDLDSRGPLLDPLKKHQPTLVSAAAEGRQRRLDFLRRAVDIARALDADAVSFWSGRPDDGAGESECLRRLVDGCRTLCDYAAAAPVRLAFEPEPGMAVDTMDRFANLFESINHPSFGLTLDIGHLHCQGEVPIADHLRRWKDVLWNVHIEDMRRGVHEHLMFGEGEIDFDPVLSTLAAIGYAGGVHVELSRHGHDAVETARRSLAFLRART